MPAAVLHECVIISLIKAILYTGLYSVKPNSEMKKMIEFHLNNNES